MIIEVLDSTRCKVNDDNARLILPAISYEREFWISTKEGKKRKHKTENCFYAFSNGYWYFLSGLLPRILWYCNQNNINCEVDNKSDAIPFISPELPGISLRPDQIDLIILALQKQRGVIKATARSGKTIIQAAIVSAFPQKPNILLLTHLIDIASQTYEVFKGLGFGSIELLGGGSKDLPFQKRITIATRQTFANIKPKAYHNRFQVVIVDEAHHISSTTGEYGTILKNINAPVRLGFTATTPNTAKTIFALEGLIGPIIGELSYEEAMEIGILAKPEIKIIKIPFDPIVHDCRTYNEVYYYGITMNDRRNTILVQTAVRYMQQGKSVLILVWAVEHGIQLQNKMTEQFGFALPYLYSQDDSERRNRLKQQLINKEIYGLIVSSIWKEGLDLPTLDVLINAAGGKSEIPVIQSLSRVLTKTDEKDHGIIIDTFDSSHHYLISHFGERISLYFNLGWIDTL